MHEIVEHINISYMQALQFESFNNNGIYDIVVLVSLSGTSMQLCFV